MKRSFILFMFILCGLNMYSGNKNTTIYDVMKQKGIDYIFVNFFPGLLAEGCFYVRIYSKEASFVLDTIKYVNDEPIFVEYNPNINNKQKEYILSCINSFFVSKTKPIYKYYKKLNYSSESDDPLFSIYFYKKKKLIKEKQYILGDFFGKKPSVACNILCSYTKDFKQFIQFLLFICASQGPYNERYHSLINRYRGNPDVDLFDFCE